MLIKLKKYTALILSFMFLFSSVSFANYHSDVTLMFSDFSYTISDYDKNDVTVDYEKTLNKEIATIRNKDTQEILETVEVDVASNRKLQNRGSAQVFSSRSTYPHTFTRTKRIGRIELTLKIIVEMYSSGSFRQINNIQTYFLGISQNYSDSVIEDKSVSVWSSNGFPTTSLMYGYAGNLVAEVNISETSTVGAELAGLGFSVSGSTGRTVYYRKTFNSSGKINLY